MPSLSDWNYFIRPNLIIPTLAIYLIGYLSSKNSLFDLNFYLGGIIATLMYAASITINHYFDYKWDKKSKDLYRFPIARGSFSRKFALNFTVLLIILALVFSFRLSSLSLTIVILGIFWLFAYSAPPLRIKTKPFLEIFWNGVGYGFFPFYLALSTLNFSLNLEMVLLSLIPFCVVASGHVLLQVPDIQTDRKTKQTTTNALYGKQFAVKLSRALIGFAGLIIFYLWYVGFLNYLALVSLGFGTLIFAMHKRLRKLKDVRKAFKALQVAYVVGGILFILSII